MNAQVFGCPQCNQRFQVLAEQAGQVVQCPTCAQTVEIPASAFTDAAVPLSQTSSPSDSPPSPSQIFQCQHCAGQFGVTPDMNGTQVGCPHCQQTLLIQFQSPSDIPAVDSFDEITSEDRLEFKSLNTDSKRRRAKKSDGFIPPTVTPHPLAKSSDLAPPKIRGPSESEKVLKPVQKKERRENSQSEMKTPPVQQRHKTKSDDLNLTPENRRDKSAVVTGTEVKLKAIETRPPAPPASADYLQIETTKKSVKTDTSGEPKTGEQAESVLADSDRWQPAPIEHLLPVRFDLADPTHLRIKTGSEFKVYLPDGSGGTKQFDERVLRVEHGGEKIALIAMSPQQKLRRRIISNLIAMVICITILAIAFKLLT